MMLTAAGKIVKVVKNIGGRPQAESAPSTMSSSAYNEHGDRRRPRDTSVPMDVDPALPAQLYANEGAVSSALPDGSEHGQHLHQAMDSSTPTRYYQIRKPASEPTQVQVADQRDRDLSRHCGAELGEAEPRYRTFSEAVATQTQPASSALRSHGHSQSTESANVHKAELESLRLYYEKHIEGIQQKEQELRARLQQSQMNTQSMQNQYEHEHARRCAAEKLNDLRRNELQEAQAYLEKSDTMSAQDIVSLVRALNSEIFQFAASVAEATPLRAEGHQENEDIQKLYKVIGPELASVVQSMPLPSVDPEFLFQTVIQVALTSVSRVWTTLFDARAPTYSEAQESIRSVYRSIRSASPQSVSARWRALVYSRHKYENPDEARNILYGKLERALKIVVRALGYVVTNQMLSGITPIADAIIKFDRAGGEAALSQSMVPIFIKAGTQFSPDEMEDANGSTEAKDTVVGCIELGLGSYERGDSGKRTSKESPLLLKPVVLLASAFYEN
ncbi:hypothetical protein CYLTODRAFT_493171 [Cylindrobasidium torrendii FP15055 ss-10]|uniref:Uncharacterized protein n=1 Tax=Cylindrobasidium torrendii FP15055 ss-10 TaxID=1314674 RepID=A0A0D7B2H8_9AGAR|nr:hypothetical protein CYLTODRAFT_493171 [Cylindrobasidium torrendii FP15055 ss-10]